jgi:hypothetical protein
VIATAFAVIGDPKPRSTNAPNRAHGDNLGSARLEAIKAQPEPLAMTIINAKRVVP